MFRHLILCLVLLVTAIAPSAALNRSDRAYPLLNPAAFSQQAAAASSDFDSAYKLSLPQPVQDKNFFLLSLFQRNREVRKLLSKNRVLQAVSKEKLSALGKAETCNDVGCFDQLIRLSDPTIEAVALELEILAQQPQFKALAKNDLRPSGVFVRYRQHSDAQLLVAAWRDAAKGMNRILTVYCLGKDPTYKDIDRVSFDVSKKDYSDLLRAKIKEIKLSKQPAVF